MVNLQNRVADWFNGAGMPAWGKDKGSFESFLGRLSGELGSPAGPSLAELYEQAYGALPVLAEWTGKAALEADHRWDTDPFLRPLAELRQYVAKSFSREEILGFFVHGSLATMDYIPGYSDLDTLVILRERVMEDPSWAEDVRRRLVRSLAYLYLLDPLQHHPHFILSELDLRHYFEPTFPLVLFSHAVDLTGRHEIIRTRSHNPAQMLRETFDLFCGYLVDPDRFGLGDNNSYRMKQYVQCVLLMPAIYLQLFTGAFIYKRGSFDEARARLPEQAWGIVEKASEIRTRCTFSSLYPYALRRLIGTRLDPRILHKLHRNFDRNIVHCFRDILGTNYRREAKVFVEAMRQSVKAEGKYGLE